MRAIALLALTALSLSANIATAQTGDEIITKHIEAIGGEKNWEKINSTKFTGVISMGGMEIPASRTIVKNKGMRMEISVMGMNGYIILTPKGGWTYMPFQPGMEKVTPMTEDQVSQSKGMLNIRHALLADKSLITKAVYAGVDTIEKAACHKVLVTDKSGNEQTAYFDMGTYYLVRTEVKGNTGDGEMRAIAVNFSNFKKQPEGIVLPFTESSAAFGGDFKYETVEINKPVSDNAFMPTGSGK